KSAQDKSPATKPGRREAASLEPHRLNLGCGTLIVIFTAVALAGKLLPHTGRGGASHDKAESVGEPSPQPTTPADKPSRKPGASAVLPPGQAKPGSKAAQSSEPGFEQMLETIASGIQQLLTVAGHAASPVGRLSVSLPKFAVEQSPESDPEAVPDNAPTRQSPKHDPSPVPRPGKPPSAQVVGNARQRLTDPPSSAQVPDQRTVSVGDVPHPEADMPLGAVVFNSPWTHSVEQVERYLKRHTHDPGSLEIIEWGKVQAAPEGFQVRCSFRSKNVLGNVATQSRNFVLSHDGTVVDIRD
ncbi:MAG: hypothetical protein ACK443_04620, partial [Methylococcaceae bacterium]